MTASLTAHEKPRRAQLRAGRGCDRRFVRGGLFAEFDASYAGFVAPVSLSRRLAECGFSVHRNPGNGPIRAVVVSDLDHPRKESGASSFCTICAGRLSFSFGLCLSAFAAKLLSCFVFHGLSDFGVAVTGDCRSFLDLEATVGRVCAVENLLGGGVVHEVAAEEIPLAVIGVILDHGVLIGFGVFGVLVLGHVVIIPNRFGYARGKMHNLKFSFPNSQDRTCES
jgi:hypothetical protein